MNYMTCPRSCFLSRKSYERIDAYRVKFLYVSEFERYSGKLKAPSVFRAFIFHRGKSSPVMDTSVAYWRSALFFEVPH